MWYTEEKRPMREKESKNRNFDTFSKQFLELVNVLMEASRNFLFIFLFIKAAEKYTNHMRMYRLY
jgi:hypothetical protein